MSDANQYLNVFPESLLGYIFAIFAVLVLGIIGVIIASNTQRKTLKGVSIAVIAVTSVGLLATAHRGSEIEDGKIIAAGRNILAKYDAELQVQPGSLPRGIVHMPFDEPHFFVLKFRDGSVGSYSIHFDRKTSEPFIDGQSPSGKELEEKASK